MNNSATDDPMETDADRHGDLGEDIEILDFAGDELLDEEDEYMNEDDIALNEQILATTPPANDDVMVDGGHNEEVLYDSTSQQDEDLQDVEEFVAPRPEGGNGAVNIGAGRRSSTTTYPTDPVHDVGLATLTNPNHQALEQQPSHIAATQNGYPPNQDGSFEAIGNNLNGQGNSGQSREPTSTKPSYQDTTVEPLKSDLNVPEQQENPTAQAIQTRHVSLSYDGAELSLFRSSKNQDFLLEDDQLIDANIVKLLAACKPILGEEVANHELVIGVDDLDLEISEVSSPTIFPSLQSTNRSQFAVEAGVTTVAHLCDLYWQLQLNDDIESPQNLHLNLYSRTTISDRLSLLRNAADTGVGLSAVSRHANTRTDEEHDFLGLQGDGGVGEDEEEILPGEEQSFEESSDTVEQEDTLSVHSAPAGFSTSAPDNTETISDTKAASGSTANNSKGERSAKKVADVIPKHQNTVPKKAVEKNDNSHPLNKNDEQKKGLADDDDLINYEDQEEIEPNSSTLPGNAGQDLSSTGNSASATDNVPIETTQTLEGSNTNELSNLLYGNGGEEESQGLKEKDDQILNTDEQGKSGSTELNPANQRNEGTEEYDHAANVEDEFGVNVDEYEYNEDENANTTSIEGQTEFPADSATAGRDESDFLGSRNFDVQDLDNEAGLYGDSEEVVNTAEQDFEAAENLTNIIDDSTLLTTDQGIDDFQDPAENSNPALLQSEDLLDDKDEITFDDDDYDEGQSKSFDTQQDQLLNPKKRNHPDADEDTAIDPQGKFAF